MFPVSEETQVLVAMLVTLALTVNQVDPANPVTQALLANRDVKETGVNLVLLVS